MRKLWKDPVTWTRLYIVDVTEDSPEADATAGRLLQNQVDIGDAITPFYGDAAGSQFTALLQDHILIAADLLAAAKAGDERASKRPATAGTRTRTTSRRSWPAPTRRTGRSCTCSG